MRRLFVNSLAVSLLLGIVCCLSQRPEIGMHVCPYELFSSIFTVAVASTVIFTFKAVSAEQYVQ
jgi:hypothetical protein